MDRLVASPSARLAGTARVPSDKSISHRALMLGALAEGVTRIDGLLEAEDVLASAAALRAFGAGLERDGGRWIVRGGRWTTPRRALDLGNAGTGVRLLIGVAAGQGVAATFVGDPSLMKRPMDRVLDPLRAMGLEAGDEGGRLPVRLVPSRLSGLRYELPVPSAQVKSAVLLAGLGASGPVTVVEPVPTRDHTERMLSAFGAAVERDGNAITLNPRQRLVGASQLMVPADPSSAAFPLVAALVTEGSRVTLEGVMLNPRRAGLIAALRRMGARIEMREKTTVGGEVVADLVASSGPLNAIRVPPGDVPDMVDEVPILAVAAAFAAGTTRIEGLAELKVKESDRLAATARLLEAAGVTVRSGADWLEIDGTPRPAGGGEVETGHDHRIGMAALVLGLGAAAPMVITGAAAIATSFPGFSGLMNGLGARITEA